MHRTIRKIVALVSAIVICFVSGCGWTSNVPLDTTAAPVQTADTTLPPVTTVTSVTSTTEPVTTEPPVTTEDPHIAAAEEGRAMLKNAAERVFASSDSLYSFLKALDSDTGFFAELDAEGKLSLPKASVSLATLLKSFGVYFSTDMQAENFLAVGKLFFSGARVLNSVITGIGDSLYVNLSPLYAYIIKMTANDYGATEGDDDESEAVNEILDLLQNDMYTECVEWVLDLIDCAVDAIDRSAFELHGNELTVTITPENAAGILKRVGEFMLADTSVIDKLEATLIAADDYLTLVTPQMPSSTEATTETTTEATTTETTTPPELTEETSAEPPAETTNTVPPSAETTTEPPTVDTTTEPPSVDTTTEPPVIYTTTEPPVTEATTTEPSVTETSATEPPAVDTTTAGTTEATSDTSSTPAEPPATDSTTEPPAEETTPGEPIMPLSYRLSEPAPLEEDSEKTLGESYRAIAELFKSATADMFEGAVSVYAMGSKLSLLGFNLKGQFNGELLAIDYYKDVLSHRELSVVYQSNGKTVLAVDHYTDLYASENNCTLEAFFDGLTISAVYSDNSSDGVHSYKGAAGVSYEGETSFAIPIVFDLSVSDEELKLSASVESEELVYTKEELLAAGNLTVDVVLRKSSEAEIVTPTERVVPFKDFASRGNYAIAMIRAMMSNKYLKILADLIWGS